MSDGDSVQLAGCLDPRLRRHPYICRLPTPVGSAWRSGIILLPLVLLGLGPELPSPPGGHPAAAGYGGADQGRFRSLRGHRCRQRSTGFGRWLPRPSWTATQIAAMAAQASGACCLQDRRNGLAAAGPGQAILPCWNPGMTAPALTACSIRLATKRWSSRDHSHSNCPFSWRTRLRTSGESPMKERRIWSPCSPRLPRRIPGFSTVDGCTSGDICTLRGDVSIAGPRADLQAITDRILSNRIQAISNIQAVLLDAHLKANAVPGGIRSYSDFVGLAIASQSRWKEFR